jgi:hypothetical protein
MMNTSVAKLMSGRFLLTLCAGAVWGWLAYTGALAAEFNAGLITLIVTAYFGKQREGEQ